MAHGLHLVTLAGFMILMATAAVEDIRRLAIPNALILGLLLLWPIHLAVTPAISWPASAETAGAALAVFLGGTWLFSRRLIGGGDVKLLAAAALWVGAMRVPALLLLTGIGGGALSLLLLMRLWTARRAASPQQEADATGGKRVAVPYGVAIAGAALIVTLHPQMA